MSKRFLFTILTFIVIAIAAGVAIFLAKGYRYSPRNGAVLGTGILSITSVPDQASVYLDGHLTTATNANINSLPPKNYDVKIVKEGFIAWEKKIDVKEGLVTEVKATLFRAIPSIYPLTYSGALNVSLSPDAQSIAYVVPSSPDNGTQAEKRTGVWVWQMSEKPISFARGAEPHQIAQTQPGLDYSKATIRWSPDSTQLMLTFPDRTLLLDTNKFNDPPSDITATLASTQKSWDDDQKAKDLTRLQLIKDLSLRQTASAAAVLRWAPDESKFMYSSDGKKDFKVVDLGTGKQVRPQKTYDLPQIQGVYSWLSDSEHLLVVESEEVQAAQTQTKDVAQTQFKNGKISVIEFDGFNKDEIYAGSFDPGSVFVWPDNSRLVMVSSLPIATASQPNLFGINLK